MYNNIMINGYTELLEALKMAMRNEKNVEFIGTFFHHKDGKVEFDNEDNVFSALDYGIITEIDDTFPEEGISIFMKNREDEFTFYLGGIIEKQENEEKIYYTIIHNWDNTELNVDVVIIEK